MLILFLIQVLVSSTTKLSSWLVTERYGYRIWYDAEACTKNNAQGLTMLHHVYYVTLLRTVELGIEQ